MVEQEISICHLKMLMQLYQTVIQYLTQVQEFVTKTRTADRF